MEPVDFNKAPQGATHFLRYDSGYVVWCCVIEDGPNGLPFVKEWDSFNEYWVPAIHGADYYYSIGMQWIEAPAPAPQAPAQPEAPKGATHRYDHAGSTAWYREVDGKLFVWRDGSWHAGVSKSIPELAASCMLGKLTSLVEEQADLIEDDLTWLVRVTCGTLEPWCEFIARSGCDSWACTRVFDLERDWFTREQYLARRAKLQNKPSWKDAPEWATLLAQDSAAEDGLGAWWWYEAAPTECERTWSHQGRAYPAQFKGEVLGDWRDTLERRPAAAPESPVDMALKIIGGSDITSMQIAEWAERMRQSGIEQKAQEVEDLALRVATLLRENPGLFSANELSDLNELTGAELTKRDAAVCGGQKYLDAHWFERGELPPIGTVCQAKLWDRDWATMTIKGYHENTVWAGTNLCSLDKAKFRPCHPDHNSLREVLEQQTLLPEEIGPLTDAILAAGFRRDGGAA